jgi:hypothetical protein
LAISCCWIDPPDRPCANVYRIGPYRSTIRSLSIITDSAETIELQLLPSTFSDDVATMKPRESARSICTFCAPPCEWYVLQFAPKG